MTTMSGEVQRKSNQRLGWILASVALAFAVGFVVKVWWFASA